MDDENWPLTSRAIADSERAAGPSDDDLTDEDEPVQGNALLRELAAESGGRLRELSPGRFYVSKLEES